MALGRPNLPSLVDVGLIASREPESLLQIKRRKSAKGSLESKKRAKQSYMSKTELQEQSRPLTPRRHYPRLGMAELASPFSPIQHSMPRRDARRLGVDGAARKLALHQGLNA
ncbi:hypothetical protein PIB30_089736 [Stylosanthes scabra]|uniref:Uncharacterized protein n=1 Tax=Stylosanthes scabra TaxID=79078 RepID=A0ABU6RUB7_9FABA|nr:hypothetical protein [Stylosanthes scabra]